MGDESHGSYYRRKKNMETAQTHAAAIGLQDGVTLPPGVPGGKKVQRKRKSPLYKMLNSHSTRPIAVYFSYFITCFIVVAVVDFVLSTDRRFMRHHSTALYHVEGVCSVVFLIEYLLRLFTVTESKKYRDPICGRLKYMSTWRALIDLVSFAPFFMEFVIDKDLPAFGSLRVIRIFRILKTEKYMEVMQSLKRVLWFNRHMLVTAAMLDLMFMFLTATALYFFRPGKSHITDEEAAENFKSIGAAFYLSVLMLTGQGLPEGFVLPWYTKVMVMMTAVFSVAVFAIPAGIITWGFEAEAERLAWKTRETKKRKEERSERRVDRCRKRICAEVMRPDASVSVRVLHRLCAEYGVVHVDLVSDKGVRDALGVLAKAMAKAKPSGPSLCTDPFHAASTSSGSSSSDSSEWDMPEALSEQTREWESYQKIICGGASSDEEDTEEDRDRKLRKEVMDMFQKADRNLSGDLDVAEVFALIKKMHHEGHAAKESKKKQIEVDDKEAESRTQELLQELSLKIGAHDDKLKRLESQLEAILTAQSSV